jgi:hypothetical protein
MKADANKHGTRHGHAVPPLEQGLMDSQGVAGSGKVGTRRMSIGWWCNNHPHGLWAGAQVATLAGLYSLLRHMRRPSGLRALMT